MLQITEDTPPDMLAGAMDLTVHLPTGRSVKMSVERSTPMMDLLVQITTNYQLQLSGYTLQALGMAPSKVYNDTILPYKPNTPIGALDTQHIKVVPKPRNISVLKNVPPGHQPFESTFRLKVHLPRNQLYVSRVSQSVFLEDIMKKVCEEKNLDPLKYEFRHPGNLDEILDPKLTLSDYAITEIHLVQKGSSNLTQTFSADIMALRKEEDRKQTHNKTGGLNLCRRGKSSTGSLSSDNRSISPTHSDDSRSVTPPGVQQQIITPSSEPSAERPKPPQRKRRPAPKPPVEETNKPEVLTICHSRNSSDSSGYHEASVLSDNCNTSLPRRPKSTAIIEETQKTISEHQSLVTTSNLSKMSAHSRSTSSLAFPSRKKKAAPPPPPPVLKSENAETNLEEPSPVVASQPCTVVARTEIPGNGRDSIIANNTNPKPTPRNRTKIAPSPRPRSLVSLYTEEIEEKNKEAIKINRLAKADNVQVTVNTALENNEHKSSSLNAARIDKTEDFDKELGQNKNKTYVALEVEEKSSVNLANHTHKTSPQTFVNVFLNNNKNTSFNNEPEAEVSKGGKISPVQHRKNVIKEKVSELTHKEMIKIETSNDYFKTEAAASVVAQKDETEDLTENIKHKIPELAQLQKQSVEDVFRTTAFVTSPKKVKPPEVVALHPKAVKKDVCSKSMFDSYSRKRGFQIGSSLLDLHSDEEFAGAKNHTELSTSDSVASALNVFDFVDEIEGFDVEMFTGSLSKNSKNKSIILNQLHGMHELDNYPKTMKKNPSGGSLRSVKSFPGFLGTNMKKWTNVEDLDGISLHSCGGHSGWVIGDTSDTESVASTTNTSQQTPLVGLNSVQQSLPVPNTDQKTQEEEQIAIPVGIEAKNVEEKENELETDWQYQLPSPPKAFRDSSPVTFTEVNHESVADSVVTSPELFEKLKVVMDQSEKETASDITSMVSEEEKPILNKLSLENLEKRKSLVYNRELATSLKIQNEEQKNDTFSSSLVNFEKTFDEIKQSSPKSSVSTTSTLPNFKITTYNPKQKLDIFEDDTIRSNTDRASKRNSIAESTFSPEKNYVKGSMENVSFRKNSLGKSYDDFNKSDEYKFYKPPAPKTQFNVFRSESFTREQAWIPSKPVIRSKSQIALNKYIEKKNISQTENDNLTKSSSLFDVSGLQSLGVMRLIQNKLNTPNNSAEQLDKEEPSYQKQPEIKSEVQNQVEEKPTAKNYKYRPPSINMGTWSERPKIPVNVKEDPDYKYSVKDTSTSKLLVDTVNNNIKIHNNIEVRNKMTPNNFTNAVSVRVGHDIVNKNVNIKVNGFEPVNQNSGNVVIKIGGANSSSNKPIFRKPLGNVNIENQRPHSITFGNDFDISRVPIVRSVEFKKPYKNYQISTHNATDNNTSITQIFPPDTFVSNKNGDPCNPSKHNESSMKPQVEPKPVFRVNSYHQKAPGPVVRGFRSGNEVNRMSWNQPHSFSTLPAKPLAKNFSLNAPIPFTQSNLRRTESTNVENKNVPPPAPVMPKTFNAGDSQSRDNCGDPKEQLLQAIRDFGGKKGLRAVKA